MLQFKRMQTENWAFQKMAKCQATLCSWFCAKDAGDTARSGPKSTCVQPWSVIAAVKDLWDCQQLTECAEIPASASHGALNSFCTRNRETRVKEPEHPRTTKPSIQMTLYDTYLFNLFIRTRRALRWACQAQGGRRFLEGVILKDYSPQLPALPHGTAGRSTPGPSMSFPRRQLCGAHGTRASRPNPALPRSRGHF